jgi:hypothetical protein
MLEVHLKFLVFTGVHSAKIQYLYFQDYRLL